MNNPVYLGKERRGRKDTAANQHEDNLKFPTELHQMGGGMYGLIMHCIE